MSLRDVGSETSVNDSVQTSKNDNRQTDRQTDRQTGRQSDSYIYTEHHRGVIIIMRIKA
jgi:hypothetical protein